MDESQNKRGGDCSGLLSLGAQELRQTSRVNL